MAHIVSTRARDDLDHLWDYLYQESGGETVADRQVDAIAERFYLLSDYPQAGRVRDDLGIGRRSFTVQRRYVIVYTVTAAGDVLILRVADGRQDIKALMGRDSAQ